MTKTLLIITLSLATLSACGVKGPLYFPESSATTQQP